MKLTTVIASTFIELMFCASDIPEALIEDRLRGRITPTFIRNFPIGIGTNIGIPATTPLSHLPKKEELNKAGEEYISIDELNARFNF